MNILVVGTGSIGKRHIANLLALGVQVRAYSYRLASGAAQSGSVFDDARVQRVLDLNQALASDVQAVVVANRTDQHLPVALQAARHGKHLFIEKPLAASLAQVQHLVDAVAERGTVVEAGFMLRHHPNLRWMQTHLASGALGELMHVRAAVGQWLPDWRPGTDHRQGYGAFRAQGGGVIFDLVHELDLVHWLVGPVVDASAMTRVVPALEIETEGIAQIGLRMASGVLAQVHLDYVRPGYGREMELVGRHGVLTWDYAAGTVSLTRAGAAPEVVHRVPEGFERNTLFRDHMAHFLQRIEKPSLPASSSLADAVSVLRIALAAHQSDRERRCVRPEDVTP
ncbi:Gfo/Idh/MocA family oxidoreductase [Hydrogenophaga sp.]|uniref:Gfo/Idh/MocA family protein n=1 Tax=Hydrogenophaga sp. TaxID=1904254 RepID=UPI0025C4AEAE|nr:Gfo/Idh/MocA family oxidoreductase [Hydrogenophaga sp.]